MALPWLIGAAAVATVGYLATSSDSSSSDDDDYYERKRDVEKREKRRKEVERQESKNNFYDKWNIKHNENSIDAPEIQKLIKKEKKFVTNHPHQDPTI